MSTITIEAQGLLFDMDGVLVSSIGSVNRCWKRWAQHYGVPNADTFQIPHGVRAVDIIKMLKPDLDVAEGLKLIEDMELEDVSDLKVLPGVKTLLESLPAERWAIVTSATFRLFVGRLKAAQLPQPDRIVSGDRVERGKPDPEPYRLGARILAIPPSKCIVFEDAPSGIRAGIAAGCQVLGVLGTHSATELSNAGTTWITPSLENVRVSVSNEGLQITLKTL